MMVMRNRWQVALEDTTDGEQAMECPACGGNYMHFVSATESSDPVLSFWCEECGDDQHHKLHFRFHKGHTMMSWELDEVSFAKLRVMGKA